LKGEALSYFEHHLMRRLEAEDSEFPDNKLIELLLRDVGLECIPKHYMRLLGGLHIGLNMSVKQLKEKLNDLNRYLLYFPEESSKHLEQDEIMKILDQAKAGYPEWHEAMANAKILTFSKFLMKNQLHTSSVWRTWRILGTPTVQILLHKQ
jgi:hypothetical protein